MEEKLEKIEEEPKDEPIAASVPPVQKEQPKMFFPLSIVCGVLGIVLSPMVLMNIIQLEDSVMCQIFYVSGFLGLIALFLGFSMVMTYKDMRGFISIFLAIIIGVLAVIPLLAALSLFT